MICSRCREEKLLTYRVISDVIDMLVCSACALRAFELANGKGQVGQIRVEAIEEAIN